MECLFGTAGSWGQCFDKPSTNGIPLSPLSLKWRGQESGGAEAAQYSSTCSWTMILSMVW